MLKKQGDEQMLGTETELMNSILTKIKQNKLVYRPEQLTALYYVTYFQNKTDVELQKLEQDLQKRTTIIAQEHARPNLMINFSKQKIDPHQALDLQIKHLTDSPIEYRLLLDNQLLAKIKAPYRTVLLNATIDLAKNYESLIVPKNKYETILINLFKHVTQGILLVSVQDGAILGAIPCTGFLTYEDPLAGKKTSAIYQPDPKMHYANYLKVTVKELTKLLQPVKLVRANNVPLYHLHFDRPNYVIDSKDKQYNGQIGFMEKYDEVISFIEKYDEVGNHAVNDSPTLNLIKKALITPEKIPAQIWSNKIKNIFNTDYTSITICNLQKYLLNELMWEIDQQGRFKLFTVDHLSYWDKLLTKYQTNDIEHIKGHLTKCDHDLRKDPDSVYSIILADVVSDFLNQKYPADHEKYLKKQLYHIFGFPKTHKLAVQDIAFKQPKKQVNWHLKPLMPAKGINQVLQDIANNQGQVFYEQGYLTNVDTECRYDQSTDALADKVIVRKIKL